MPLAIEARGIGLLSVPLIKGSELFYFVKLGQHSVERLSPVCNKFCLGKPIRLIYFDPRSGNTSALFLMLKHGFVIHTDWHFLYLDWELKLLSCIGFGLDLEKCAVTETREDLCYISPKSGKAVCKEVGTEYHSKLRGSRKFYEQT